MRQKCTYVPRDISIDVSWAHFPAPCHSVVIVVVIIIAVVDGALDLLLLLALLLIDITNLLAKIWTKA